MRKMQYWVVLGGISVCLAACGGGSSSGKAAEPEQKTETVQQTEKSEEDTKKEAEQKEETKKAEPKEEKKTASLEEQIIWEENGLTVTAKGIEESLFGPEIKLLIENAGDRNLTVQARKASVNGFMVDTMMSADVAAGKKVNAELTLSASDLKNSGIAELGEIEFVLHAFDSASWSDSFDSETIHLETSIAGSFEQAVDESGELILDENGIRIFFQGYSEDSSMFGPSVLLLIENDSDRDWTVQVRDCSVNGFMVDPMISAEIAAGKKGKKTIGFMKSELEKNEIDKIETAEFRFHIFDDKNWENNFDTEMINIVIPE